MSQMSACRQVNDIIGFNNDCRAMLVAPFVLSNDCFIFCIFELMTFHEYNYSFAVMGGPVQLRFFSDTM